MGKVISIYYSKDGKQDVYNYTLDGQVQRIATTQGATTSAVSYTYTTNGQLDAETQADGTVLAYGYDAAGNRTQVSITKSGQTTPTTIHYTYDGFNRLKTVIDASGTTSYSYDAVGNLKTLGYPNGLTTTYAYNSINQLTNLTTRNAANTIVSSYSYGLDATGRRESITEQNGRFTQYQYDDLYHLTNEIITDVINGNYAATYQYDLVGNRTYETVDGVQTAYSYDNNDRLIQTGGTTYSYDDNGNTLTETLDANVKTYVWDSKNKLSSTTQNSATTRYTYNPDGIRTSKHENGVTTNYIVDSNRDYAQVLEEVENNLITVQYTYGHDLINQQRAATTSFYHYDGLGSTRALSDSDGALTDSYNYEAFGTLKNQSGSTDNNYLFTGEQFDSSLNQYYLRARYYDQNIGRFTQMDTWAGSNHDPVTLHKYLYANASPANYIDPTGNFSMGSLMSSINVMGSLAVRSYSIYSRATLIMDIASGDVTATELAAAYIAGRFLPRSAFKCKNSFAGDTLVYAEFGLKPIKDIKIGDKVWAYDVVTEEKTLQEVIHVIEGEGIKELVDIEVSSGEVITATQDHPFYLFDTKKWTDAGALSIDNLLFNIDGQSMAIESLKPHTQETFVYNLSVSGDHTYFVGEAKVLAHNCYQKPGWTPHGNKHKSDPKWDRKKVIESTKSGPAKYFMSNSDDIRKFELDAWKSGIAVTNGKPWKVKEFGEDIGAKNGKASRWLRLEYSEGGDVIHGHPITLDEFRKLLK